MLWETITSSERAHEMQQRPTYGAGIQTQACQTPESLLFPSLLFHASMMKLRKSTMLIFCAPGPLFFLTSHLCSENPISLLRPLGGWDLPRPLMPGRVKPHRAAPQGLGLSEPYLSLWNEKFGHSQFQTSEPLAHIKLVLFL